MMFVPLVGLLLQNLMILINNFIKFLFKSLAIILLFLWLRQIPWTEWIVAHHHMM
jgi:hypothetical protein